MGIPAMSSIYKGHITGWNIEALWTDRTWLWNTIKHTEPVLSMHCTTVMACAHSLAGWVFAFFYTDSINPYLKSGHHSLSTRTFKISCCWMIKAKEKHWLACGIYGCYIVFTENWSLLRCDPELLGWEVSNILKNGSAFIYKVRQSEKNVLSWTAWPW